jgi:hypothetical protein
VKKNLEKVCRINKLHYLCRNKTIELMKNYELCLYDKLQKDLIDSILIANCKDRNEALSRVKRLFMFQGLRLSDYGYTLKKTNKVKEYLVD